MSRLRRVAAGLLFILVFAVLVALTAWLLVSGFRGVLSMNVNDAAPASHDVPAIVYPTLTRAETRARIELAGHTWAQFMAQTNDRPRYDVGFVEAWLNQRSTP